MAALQVSLRALNALGEHAAEHGRGALKDTSAARLHLHGLRQDLKAVTDELESGYKALPQKEQDKKKRKRDVSEMEHAVAVGDHILVQSLVAELDRMLHFSNEALNKNMITYRK